MTYRERLTVPVWWWLVGGAFTATMALAVWAYLGWQLGLAATVLFFCAVAALLRVTAPSSSRWTTSCALGEPASAGAGGRREVSQGTRSAQRTCSDALLTRAPTSSPSHLCRAPSESDRRSADPHLIAGECPRALRRRRP